VARRASLRASSGTSGITRDAAGAHVRWTPLPHARSDTNSAHADLVASPRPDRATGVRRRGPPDTGPRRHLRRGRRRHCLPQGRPHAGRTRVPPDRAPRSAEEQPVQKHTDGQSNQHPDAELLAVLRHLVSPAIRVPGRRTVSKWWVYGATGGRVQAVPPKERVLQLRVSIRCAQRAERASVQSSKALFAATQS
jgi:hypothetical protein